MLDEQAKEQLRDRTVDVVLELRAEYLRTPSVNVLRHWDQIQDRMRIAARTSAGPEEWATSIARALRLGPPRPPLAKAIFELASDVHERGCSDAWLDLVEREFGYVMAKARLLSEQRKENRDGGVP